MYKIWRSYASKPNELPTNDVLEAVKISLNYEADLYYGTRCIVSWMGYDMEENIRRLAKEGIESYVVDGQYCFRYRNPEMNIKRYYFYYNPRFLNEGELHINDYPSKEEQPFYSSIDEIIEIVKTENPLLERLTVLDFSGEKYQGSYELNVKNSMVEK